MVFKKKMFKQIVDGQMHGRQLTVEKQVRQKPILALCATGELKMFRFWMSGALVE